MAVRTGLQVLTAFMQEDVTAPVWGEGDWACVLTWNIPRTCAVPPTACNRPEGSVTMPTASPRAPPPPVLS